MPYLALLAVLAIALNSFLTYSVSTDSEWGAGWTSSPMGKLGSRLVYSHAQTPWHNGIDEDFNKIFVHLDFSAVPSFLSAIPDYFDQIYAATKPTSTLAHLPKTDLEQLSKNLVVVKLMRISLDWDPTNYQTAYDLAFLLKSTSIGHPEISLQVLDETLSHNLSDYGRLLLDVEKFQLLHLRLEHRVEARAMVPEIEDLTRKCSTLPQTFDVVSLLENARAVPIIVENSSHSKKIGLTSPADTTPKHNSPHKTHENIAP